jgi:hypothetical protein
MWKSFESWKSHYFHEKNHILRLLFSHFGARDLGLGPKMAAGRAQAVPGFRASKCENNMKTI